ncbi:hypothetical protein BD410DRAFT_809572 [Rickenella mellea]|uniref:Uncharacterized protein n=1 Tax=Rickenella mellea TaxID=50990 RepID=A0A4Y7PGQ1_9AGAM|nr:hypothetical protein BD410DRAFT_809572 [Rickenella mellea]
MAEQNGGDMKEALLEDQNLADGILYCKLFLAFAIALSLHKGGKNEPIKNGKAGKGTNNLGGEKFQLWLIVQHSEISCLTKQWYTSRLRICATARAKGCVKQLAGCLYFSSFPVIGTNYAVMVPRNEGARRKNGTNIGISEIREVRCMQPEQLLRLSACPETIISAIPPLNCGPTIEVP